MGFTITVVLELTSRSGTTNVSEEPVASKFMTESVFLPEDVGRISATPCVGRLKIK
jgi:hypothetical protein